MNSISLRSDFAKIKSQYVKLGKGNVRLTQSALTLIQPISTQKTVYTFPVLENDNSTAVLPEEIRLNMNDEFVTTDLGIYLIGRWLNRDNPETGYERLTYNPIELTQDANKAQGLYDGYLTIDVNNIRYVDKWDVAKHNIVPRTQFNNSSLAYTAGATNTYATQRSQNGGADGMYTCAPMVTLSGAKKNLIQIVLPKAISGYQYQITDNNGEVEIFEVAYVLLQLRGLLAQNAANFQIGVKQEKHTFPRR